MGNPKLNLGIPPKQGIITLHLIDQQSKNKQENYWNNISNCNSKKVPIEGMVMQIGRTLPQKCKTNEIISSPPNNTKGANIAKEALPSYHHRFLLVCHGDGKAFVEQMWRKSSSKEIE